MGSMVSEIYQQLFIINATVSALWPKAAGTPAKLNRLDLLLTHSKRGHIAQGAVECLSKRML